MLSTSSPGWRRRPAHRSLSLSPPPAVRFTASAELREKLERDKYGRRCARRRDLEFHHKRPFARGGDHSPTNLTLMCAVHNTLVAEQYYGEDVMARFRAAASHTSVPVDAYGASSRSSGR